MVVAAASFSLQAQAFGYGECTLRPAAQHRLVAHSRVCAYRITRCSLLKLAPSREAEQQVNSSMIILKRDMNLMMTQERIEMFKSLEGWVEENVLPYLKLVDRSWQPQDFFPEPSGDAFEEEVCELRRRCQEMPPAYFGLPARDYADILDYLIRRWKVDKLVGLSSRG
ncbi:hypothetical protein L7F22_051845 [Adiantum nelumboides]|nr:hypothetical protein [Adiantum nelumboides]